MPQPAGRRTCVGRIPFDLLAFGDGRVRVTAAVALLTKRPVMADRLPVELLSARLGYADGAMTSGIREAKRLLGTPSVALGRFA
jgi:hypothetical protein